jgi:polysaccharide deacetylase family protein (PEP-CTERM system associated)
MFNALSIDVEDYYMVSGFADVIKFGDWHRYESRIEKNTHTILDLLAQFDERATFFVLGWVAERYPDLVRDIYDAGHEVACHGYNHRLIYDLTPEQFREDIRMSKDILENITGAAVKGYRAASYSVVKSTLWALDILLEEGFQYDSSIYPIHHDRYGIPTAGRFPHIVNTTNGDIMEFPPSTYHIWGHNIPVAGGGYLRLFPWQLTKAIIKGINEKEKQAAMIYIHPWEIDVDQPRLKGSWKSEIRHYINIRSTISKLRGLLTEFKFKPLSALLDFQALEKGSHNV